MTDNQRVYEALSLGQVLTCKSAKERLSVHDLRSRISNLRDSGHNIQSQYVSGKRSDGRPCRYKEYWMVV